jgi:hypothetical protein
MMRLTLVFFIVLFMAGIQVSRGEPDVAKESLTAKIDQILAEKKPHDQLTQLSDLGTKLSLEEIPQALAASKNFKQWRQQVVLQQATLQHWAELAPEEAFDYIAKLPESRSKVQTVHFAAIKFATKDPESAAAAVAKLSPGPSRTAAIDTVARTWAQTEGRKALDWADGLPEGKMRDTAVMGVLFTWVHIDPVACYPRIEKLPPDNIKNALITNVANEWAVFNPQAALKWANSLPEESEKEVGIQNATISWADHDPKAAGEFALQMPPGSVRQQAIAGVAERWATQNPQEAADWVANKLDPASQQMALTRLMNFWAMESPQGAGQWVASLPAGPFRENAIQAYVQTASSLTPDLAAGQAITLTDENIRDQQVETCIRHWMELDPVAARQWLQKSDLPQYVQAQCLLPPNVTPYGQFGQQRAPGQALPPR